MNRGKGRGRTSQNNTSQNNFRQQNLTSLISSSQANQALNDSNFPPIIANLLPVAPHQPRQQQQNIADKTKDGFNQISTSIDNKPNESNQFEINANIKEEQGFNLSTIQQSVLKTMDEPLVADQKFETKLEKVKFPPKPKQYGTLGRTIQLKTNHFAIQMNKSLSFYQYDVEVTKAFNGKVVKQKDLMKIIFLEFIKKLPHNYKNKIVYNLSKNIYSLIKLPFEQSKTFDDINVDGKVYKVCIKPINEVTLDTILNDDQVSINILDLILTANLQYSCISINRSFFRENDCLLSIGIGRELWKGIYASVRPSECGLTWNVDLAYSTFLKSENLLDVACNVYRCTYDQIKRFMEADRDKKTREIGSKFINQIIGRDIKIIPNKIEKKVRGLGPQNSFSKFDWMEPNKPKINISIKDYFKQKYDVDLKYPDLLCIHIGNERFVPIELCQTKVKNVKIANDPQIIRKTAVPATDRINRIEDWIAKNEDPFINEFDINKSILPIELTGRVLPAPDIDYKIPDKISGKSIGEKGQWDHKDFKFNLAIKLERWILINFSKEIQSIDPINEFIDKLIFIGKTHGITIKKPLDIFQANHTQNILQLIENMITKHKSLEMIFGILDEKNDAYKILKTCGDLKYGVATQIINHQKFFELKDNKKDRYSNKPKDPKDKEKDLFLKISNLLLKINTKLGGKNFVLSKRNSNLKKLDLNAMFEGPVMMFGADVTHPSPGNTNASESIAAVVGSFDENCCYYGGRLWAQKSQRGQAYEMIHDLDKIVLSLLHEYFSRNKKFPNNIIFYRDGVSEGQFELVLRHEMNKIRNACKQISSGYEPSILFIVVQKRHHTRFFPLNKADKKGKSENVPPGTVVDKAVVTKFLFDFFLCSHTGIQGTSRPCRYFVLHDDSNFTMDQVQQLSYDLCHIYSRCSKSVSFPAPAYYAHLCAYRAREYIRQEKNVPPKEGVASYELEVHDNIKNTMFFT